MINAGDQMKFSPLDREDFYFIENVPKCEFLLSN
jgi:hypothetical protein